MLFEGAELRGILNTTRLSARKWQHVTTRSLQRSDNLRVELKVAPRHDDVDHALMMSDDRISEEATALCPVVHKGARIHSITLQQVESAYHHRKPPAKDSRPL